MLMIQLHSKIRIWNFVDLEGSIDIIKSNPHLTDQKTEAQTVLSEFQFLFQHKM